MAALWMIVASALFATMGVFAKLGAAHFTAAELVFWRSALGLAGMLALARLRRWPIRTPHAKLHVSRAASGVLSLGLYFWCISRLPLATAVTLNYTSPIFLALLTAWRRHERPGPVLVGAVGVAFAGIVLLLEPTLERDQWVDGLLGLASGMLAALAYHNVKSLGAVGEPPWRVVLYFTLFSTLAAMVWIAVTGIVHLPDLRTGAVLLGLAATATIAQNAMTRAYHGGATLVVGALSFVTVIFSTLYGLVLWGEALPPHAWWGVALIVAGGIASLRAERARLAALAPTSA
ncbi:MAG: DMT family transporter [Burkholderiales bacterium]|jgi:drug/metabolite transporter (DMT)-like permease|nr:DMT family transporter [Burkholderiales bacterium]